MLPQKSSVTFANAYLPAVLDESQPGLIKGGAACPASNRIWHAWIHRGTTERP